MYKRQVQAVSNESGISVYGGKNADTYFHVKVYGKAAGFSNGGDEKAKELRQDLEQNYLDRGANVCLLYTSPHLSLLLYEVKTRKIIMPYKIS